MAIELAREMLFQVAKDIEPLAACHFYEILDGKHGVQLSPDWAQFRGLEESGALYIFTARDGARLLGYDVFVLMPHRHYSHTKIAVGELLYVTPEHRGKTSIRLMNFAESQMKQSGADVISRSLQCSTDQVSLLESLGYTPSEIVMTKKV